MSSKTRGDIWLRRLVALAFLVGLLSLLALDVSTYLDGRRGSISFMLGFGLILSALGAFAFLLALVVVALIRTRERRLVVGCCCGLLVLFIVNTFIPPAELFRIGFRQRVQATVTADELRLIAQKVGEHVPVGEKLPSPGKSSLWSATQHESAWRTLTNETAAAKLDEGLCIYHHADEVQILWGGAFGHWGVIIQKSHSAKTGDIAPGIATVYGSH
jgi:hypothetical protein